MTHEIADANYTRVFPRDLFNEAKLLKCMGRLCLLILDGLTPCEMSMPDNNRPPKIGLLEEGSLTIINLPIKIKGKKFLFKTTYNSKANYPLYVQTDDYCDYLVFNEAGKFDTEFLDFVNAIK